MKIFIIHHYMIWFTQSIELKKKRVNVHSCCTSCLLKNKKAPANRGPQKGMTWKKYTSVENLMAVVGNRPAKSMPKTYYFHHSILIFIYSQKPSLGQVHFQCLQSSCGPAFEACKLSQSIGTFWWRGDTDTSWSVTFYIYIMTFNFTCLWLSY